MDEQGFLNLANQIIQEGEHRNDRTGQGTISIFSPQVITYNLENNKIPCFTTKKIAWKTTINELLCFIHAKTNSQDFEKVGCKWWVDNTTRQFLDQRGLTSYPIGEMGPMYGWQWRHAGAEYPSTDGGFDQLEWIINEIKTNPDSRRLMVSAFIPQDVDKGVLPPCHTFFQFYVSAKGLSCILYQRSADIFLGAQINVLSYSILTHMIAKLTGLKPYRFYHHIGDAHIYTSHIEAMKTQLSRVPREAPTLLIKGEQLKIEDFCIDNFELQGYDPYPTIQAKMAV
jgi:thymidylate synthase